MTNLPSDPTAETPAPFKTFPIYEPKGIRFIEGGREWLLVQEPGYHFDGWLARRHPDGQWVSMRKATDEDKAKHAAPSVSSSAPPNKYADCENCDAEIATVDDDMVNPDDPRYEHLCKSCAYAIGADAVRSGNFNIEAQEDVCSALYDFARRLGHNHEETYPQIGSTLTRIAKAYGFNVAPIQ